MTTLSNLRAELKVQERLPERNREMKGKWNLGGQRAADDVYRAHCWKSTYKAIDTKMRETPLISEPSTDSGKHANFKFPKT